MKLRRSLAALALCATAAGAADLDGLLAQLRSPSAALRREAARRLGKSGYRPLLKGAGIDEASLIDALAVAGTRAMAADFLQSRREPLVQAAGLWLGDRAAAAPSPESDKNNRRRAPP